MKGLFTVSRAFVFHQEGIKPFLIQVNTFGKWFRLSGKSLLSKTEKTQISEQTQIIWVRWSLWCIHFASLLPFFPAHLRYKSTLFVFIVKCFSPRQSCLQLVHPLPIYLSQLFQQILSEIGLYETMELYETQFINNKNSLKHNNWIKYVVDVGMLCVFFPQRPRDFPSEITFHKYYEII